MYYTDEIKRAIAANVVLPEDVYDFSESVYKEFLTNYYKFCRDNLDIQAKQEPIAPNVFLFTNSFEVNAGAGIRKKHFVIEINVGLIRSCFENYHDNTQLADFFTVLLPDTFSKFDNPANILAFQICTQFTYYHELAHLFQLSGTKDDITLKERYNLSSKSGYDRVKHILEINADTFATINVATHIEQYIERTFKDKVSIENTMDTFVFFGCCLLNYTLNFSAQPEEIYFEQQDHPHSFLRQLNVVLNLTHHVGHSPYFQTAGIVLNEGVLFRSILDVYKQLEAKGVFKTNITGIIDDSKDLSKPLANYLFSLLQFEVKEYRNAMDVWNKSATK
jgi:hypothetical protein